MSRYEIATISKRGFKIYLVIDLRTNKILRKYDNKRDCRYYINFISRQLSLEV